MTDREIVVTIATRAMGWNWNDPSPWVNQSNQESSATGAWEESGQYRAGRFWSPPTSISDAFMVVASMRERGWAFCLGEGSECWEAAFAREMDEAEGDALTIPRAICLAALAAVSKEKS